MPAKNKPAAPESAAPTSADLIKALVESFGHDPADVAGVDVTAKHIRILGKDRSLRSHTIGEAWNAKEEA